MQSSNIFSTLTSKVDAEVFEELVKKESFNLQRIISYGHTTAQNEWYDQESDEWVMLVCGEAILSFTDEEDLHLRAGDYVNIPAHKKHRVSWTKPKCETIWLALHSEVLE